MKTTPQIIHSLQLQGDFKNIERLLIWQMKVLHAKS